MGQQYQQKQENDFNEGSVLKIMKKEEIQAGKLVWLWCTSGVCSIWWVEEEGRGEGGRGRKRRRKLAGIFFGELCCAGLASHIRGERPAAEISAGHRQTLINL